MQALLVDEYSICLFENVSEKCSIIVQGEVLIVYLADIVWRRSYHKVNARVGKFVHLLLLLHRILSRYLDGTGFSLCSPAISLDFESP